MDRVVSEDGKMNVIGDIHRVCSRNRDASTANNIFFSDEKNPRANR